MRPGPAGQMLASHRCRPAGPQQGGRSCSWQRRRSRTSSSSRTSSRPRGLRSGSSTGPRARSCSAIPARTTGSGWSSTGIRTAGRASSPTPRCRRSCRRLDTRAGRRCSSSPAATRPSAMDDIKVGVIADQTGALSFMGIAGANVATMVVDDINAAGGILGRRVELILEDSATDDATAAAKAAKLVQHDHVDVLLGGIYSSTRQAIKEPAVVEGRTLYIYPEQYEGKEYDPLIFCTGPVPAQQVEPLIPWLMRRTGAKTFFLPSADYIWPHVLNQKVHEAATANGGAIVGEEYFPLDHTDYGALVERITASGAEVVFNTIVPPGLMPFLEQLHASGFTKRGGKIVCTYFDENLLGLLPAEQVDGLYGCIDYYQGVRDPFSEKLLARYDERFPGGAKLTAGSGCSGLYRGLKLWEAAVTEAGSLDQADVVAALDHAKIAEGPGGPAEMVPGQHHVRMNMYIARSEGGTFKVVESLGHIDPKECEVGTA